ncbi:MAG: cysteine hydrolase [Micavibrio sp.]|nr:cysteine hydrolase [Micavibrio sp.]
MSLIQQLKKVAEFLSPTLLAQTDLHYSPEPDDIELASSSNIALLVIDVQKEFCDPTGRRGNQQTAEVSRRIGSLVPEFRKAGIPVYMVYFSHGEKKIKDIDFYEVKPEKSDVLVAKNRDSAFRGSNIETLLQKAGHRKLLTCGFNLNACVYSTVLDARSNGFQVTLLRDLVGNDKNNDDRYTDGCIQEMKEKGIQFTQSSEVLQALTPANNSTPARSFN